MTEAPQPAQRSRGVITCGSDLGGIYARRRPKSLVRAQPAGSSIGLGLRSSLTP
jgi:hypothetical protein